MLRIAETESGRVQGYPGTDARITVFKGIPYAAPTSGRNRWRAPQPAEKWDGIRKCYEFGPITMQKIPGEDPNAFYSKEWHVDPDIPMGEDSLCVNIWTPAKSPDEKLPVMMWIFGGAFKEGYAHEMEFDGERIASRGVILVSVAYRVNVFGFMCHPDITAEAPDSPANFGLLDQRFAMDWIKRNISNFGGDPNNLTIFGQSAGGGSVWSHLCSPKARGAFTRAIPQSAGGVSYRYPSPMHSSRLDLKAAEQLGVKFLKEWLNCDTLDEARKLDAKYIEERFLESGLAMGPVIDGVYLTDDPSEILKQGKMSQVPIMTGNTSNEFMTGPSSEDEATITQWVNQNFGPHADEYMEICRRIVEREGVSLREAVTVGSFELGVQLALEYLKDQDRTLYYYIFGPTIPGDDAGAFHSSDLWFTFETLMKSWRPFQGNHYDLARKICNYWTNFAKTGDPNGPDHDGTPMPYWTPFTKESPQNIELFDKISMSEGPYSEKRAFLIRINKD
ncbi:MAG: carboxylesterase family protein [Clostridiales bacterium]|nr:carboxylesterase family protein [Clostridiales bacterium]